MGSHREREERPTTSQHPTHPQTQEHGPSEREARRSNEREAAGRGGRSPCAAALYSGTRPEGEEAGTGRAARGLGNARGAAIYSRAGSGEAGGPARGAVREVFLRVGRRAREGAAGGH